VLVDARIATHRQGGGVDEADPRTAAQLRVQVGHQGNQQRWHHLDEALITKPRGKLTTQVALDILRVIGFECPVMGLMEQDHDRHHARSDASGSHGSAGAGLLPTRHLATSAQIAARNRLRNKTVRVYSLGEPAFG
jgi:hypothetical protein